VYLDTGCDGSVIYRESGKCEVIGSFFFLWEILLWFLAFCFVSILILIVSTKSWGEFTYVASKALSDPSKPKDDRLAFYLVFQKGLHQEQQNF